jgi:thiol:disulfide interchange protein
MKKTLYFLLLISTILQSCGTSSNVTSNFALQKRKYTKGWNVKDLFNGKQNKAICETEIQEKAVKQLEKKEESTPIRSEKVEDLTAEPIAIEVAEVNLPETKKAIQSTEEYDALENDNVLATTPKIEQKQTGESRNENVDLNEGQNEKKTDYFFRIFFIIAFGLALLACILAPIPYTAEFAISLLLLLVLVDIASLVIVTILLVKRHKNTGKYKESSLIVILTEILFGLVSFLSILFFNANSAF